MLHDKHRAPCVLSGCCDVPQRNLDQVSIGPLRIQYRPTDQHLLPAMFATTFVAGAITGQRWAWAAAVATLTIWALHTVIVDIWLYNRALRRASAEHEEKPLICGEE